MSDEVAPIVEVPAIETVEHPIDDKPKKTKVGKENAKPVIEDSEEYALSLRKENAKLRKTLDEQAAAKAEEMSNRKLEELRASVEEKATSKAEKALEKRLKEMEEVNRTKLVKSELKAHALRAGVVDFDDLYSIMRSKLADVQFDDDGEVTNAAQLIAEMKASKGHLFAGVSTASHERAPIARQSDPTDKIALKMNREEYQRSLQRLMSQ